MLIVLMLIIDVMKRESSNPRSYLFVANKRSKQHDQMLITPSHWGPNVSSIPSTLLSSVLSLTNAVDWNDPYSFFNPVYSVEDENGNLQRTIAGTAGVFLGMWYVDESTHGQNIY
jgi:hypothetical protein